MDCLLQKLCSFSCPSGGEGRLREFIASEIKNYADSLYSDALGNLFAFVKGKKTAGKKVMFIAHMDEVGFIVTGIENNGLLRFSRIGGISGSVLCGRKIEFANGICGVIVPAVALHQLSGEKRKAVPTEEELFIDIGAESGDEAKKYICLGDKASFAADYYENEESVFAKALDDRIGVYALIKAIKKGPEYDAVFVFSVQEEVGLRGAAVAGNRIAPDIAVVIDSTTAADLPGTEGSDRVCVLGQGFAVSFMEKATVYDERLYKFIMNAAKDRKIPVQFKTRVAGGNDAGAIHKSGKGVRCAAISTPCRYIHSAMSVARKSDIKAVADIVSVLSAELQHYDI